MFVEVERDLRAEGDVVSLFEARYLVVVIIVVDSFSQYMFIVYLHLYCFNRFMFIVFVRGVVVNGYGVVMVYGMISRALSWHTGMVWLLVDDLLTLLGFYCTS